MQIDGLKHKIYIAVVGMPDCGKSTFIKGIVKRITQRDVPVDSFCDEQQLDMTIRSAQIFLRDKSLPYDIVFLDCPGHIFEYADEAESVLSKAHMCILIKNAKQDEVIPYNQSYSDYYVWLRQLRSLIHKKELISNTLEIQSHSNNNSDDCYDAVSNVNKFEMIYNNILKFIDDKKFIPINPIETALRIIKYGCKNIQGKKTVMCSYGKDSILMLQLLKLANCMNDVKIEYPNSGFDLSGISNDFKNRVHKFFNCNIKSFKVIEDGWNFNNHTTQDMMLCKARLLSERIKSNNYKACFTGIRRDEEGTRAKEKFFSLRNLDGSFDMLAPQKEIFMHEFDDISLDEKHNMRINPLLDLCEADVWYATKYFNLPICSEYFSKDGKRYRSLGDWPITTPIQSNASNINEICNEIDDTIIPERACRQLQDNAVKFGMEKLRKVGFF